jgi:ribosomal protein L44E
MILYAYCLNCFRWTNHVVSNSKTHKNCDSCHRTSRLNMMQLEIVRNSK